MERDRQRGNELGPTGRTVAANVKRVRQALGLTQAELSELLERNGRPIPTASIGKIESGLRKVEVDDLMALAFALDMSPLGLLLPVDVRPSENAEVIEIASMSATIAWCWALGTFPSGLGPNEGTREDYLRRSLPSWIDVKVRYPGDYQSWVETQEDRDAPSS
jgi:transcriptional regulator with XRE-family HTH domain